MSPGFCYGMCGRRERLFMLQCFGNAWVDSLLFLNSGDQALKPVPIALKKAQHGSLLDLPSVTGNPMAAVHWLVPVFRTPNLVPWCHLFCCFSPKTVDICNHPHHLSLGALRHHARSGLISNQKASVDCISQDFGCLVLLDLRGFSPLPSGHFWIGRSNCSCLHSDALACKLFPTSQFCLL